jgi:aminopeptidase 2
MPSGLDIPKIMGPWVLKVSNRSATVYRYFYCPQMGFPVLTVKETPTGIKVRQDRFLEDGPAKPEDNETIW